MCYLLKKIWTTFVDVPMIAREVESSHKNTDFGKTRRDLALFTCYDADV